MTDASAIVFLSAVELARRIRAKELSPVEVLEAFIQRIAELNPAINAVTATCYDRARREARAAEAAVLAGGQLGPLHGLPLGVKDLEYTEGLLTTFGSPLFKDHIPDADGVMVARLRRAGAIVVGKTTRPSSEQVRTRATLSGARPATPSIRCAPAVARQGGRPRRWRPTCCRSARAPIRADRSGYRRPSAASSGSGRRPAWCRRSGGNSAGRPFPCSVRWDALSRTPASCSRAR